MTTLASKTLAVLFAGAALLSAGLAHAIVPFKPIRTQVRAVAKEDGVLANRKRPSIRLDYSKSGKTVTASVYAIGRGWPAQLEKRMLVASAKFKIKSLPDGKLATPVKQQGQVWHYMMYLSGANK